MYEYRSYRQNLSHEWFSYEITVEETDLRIISESRLEEEFLYSKIRKYRKEIEGYIAANSDFKTTLSSFILKKPAPVIVEEMVYKTRLLNVGPMASVAGAIAEFLGKEIKDYSSQFVIENGGDICINKRGPINIGLYGGKDSVLNDFMLGIQGSDDLTGVCTSSGSLGHSLSLGASDLVTVISDSVIFADALATSVANKIYEESDVDKQIKTFKEHPSVKGGLIVKGEKIGFWGVELRKR